MVEMTEDTEKRCTMALATVDFLAGNFGPRKRLLMLFHRQLSGCSSKTRAHCNEQNSAQG